MWWRVQAFCRKIDYMFLTMLLAKGIQVVHQQYGIGHLLCDYNHNVDICNINVEVTVFFFAKKIKSTIVPYSPPQPHGCKATYFELDVRFWNKGDFDTKTFLRFAWLKHLSDRFLNKNYFRWTTQIAFLSLKTPISLVKTKSFALNYSFSYHANKWWFFKISTRLNSSSATIVSIVYYRYMPFPKSLLLQLKKIFFDKLILFLCKRITNCFKNCGVHLRKQELWLHTKVSKTFYENFSQDNQ